MLERFNNLRLQLQIGVVALVGVVALLVVGVVYEVSDMRAAEYRQARKAAAANFLLGKQLAEELLNARRFEKDFMLRRDESYATRHGETVAMAQATLSKLRGANPENAELQQIDDLVTQYRRVFDAYVATAQHLGLDETQGLLGQLRKSVHNVESRLKTVDAPQLQVLMLMMRRHEKDFIARLNAKYIESMKARAGEFALALDEFEAPPEFKNDVATDMASYHRDFEAMAKTMLDQVGAAKRLSASYATLEPLLERIEADNLATHKTVEEAETDNIQTTFYLMAAAFVLAIAGMIAAAWTISNGISRPVESLRSAMKALAEHDLSADIPFTERRNELGGMAKAVLVFKENMVKADELAEAQKAEQEAKAARAATLDALTRDFDAAVSGMLENFATATGELRATAQSMTATAEETTRQSTTVAAASEQTSANVQTVAAATEELNTSVSEIGRQVDQSARIAQLAVEEAERTNDTVEKLAAASQTIGEVISLINDIAGQTNLLALNATIEAARAGEAGKGFAVVASEVKSLANQTAKATEEIGTQIGAIQDTTGNVVAAIQGIGKTIREVSEIAAAIAAAVEEQTAATSDISQNVQQAAVSTQEVTSNISGVSEAAGTTGKAADQMLDATETLSHQSESLRGQVETFLAGIRAA